MTEHIKISDLCMNCSNADQCMYCRNHTKPIIFCEEFSCSEPGERQVAIDKTDEIEEYPVNTALNGLCSNCENLETCMLQHTGSTIINCEEYR